MITIEIQKNGNPIKTFTCTPEMQQKTFNKAMNIAGGKWNGKDDFKVIIK
jgi:hypothetical protein